MKQVFISIVVLLHWTYSNHLQAAQMAAPQSCGIKKINLKERTALLAEQACKLASQIAIFAPAVDEVSDNDRIMLLKQFEDIISNIQISIRFIQARQGLTFDRLKKLIAENYHKKIAYADITKAYEYLGLQTDKACQYTVLDIQEAADKFDDFMKQHGNTNRFWEIRQSQFIFGYPHVNDLSKEEYNAFLMLNAQDPEMPKELANLIELPDDAIIDDIMQIVLSLQQSKEIIEDIKDRKNREEAQEAEYVKVIPEPAELCESQAQKPSSLGKRMTKGLQSIYQKTAELLEKTHQALAKLKK